MAKIDSPELEKARKELEKAKKGAISAPDVKKEEPKAPEIAPEAEGQPSPQLVVPSPTPDPKPVDDELQRQLAEKDARIAVQQTKIDELTKRVNTEDGRHGRELQQLRETVAQLTERLTIQEAAAKAPEVPKQQTFKDMSELFAGVSPEDLEAYDEKALMVLAQVAKNAAVKASGVTKQDLAPLQDAVKKTAARTAFESFVNTVETLAPGFKAANGDAELGVAPQPEWQAFLSKPVNPELSDETWQEYAERTGGPKVAAAVYKRFLQESAGSPPAATAKPGGIERPSLAGQVAVSKSSGSGPRVADAPVYRRSEFESLQRSAARPGGLTQDVRAKLSEYIRAAAENRLVD